MFFVVEHNNPTVETFTDVSGVLWYYRHTFPVQEEDRLREFLHDDNRKYSTFIGESMWITVIKS